MLELVWARLNAYDKWELVARDVDSRRFYARGWHEPISTNRFDCCRPAALVTPDGDAFHLTPFRCDDKTDKEFGRDESTCDNLIDDGMFWARYRDGDGWELVHYNAEHGDIELFGDQGNLLVSSGYFSEYIPLDLLAPDGTAYQPWMQVDFIEE